MIRAVLFDHDTIFSSSGQLNSGADAFIRACRIRFPLLLLSAGTWVDADHALRACDLRSLFLDILTQSEVEHARPAPDLLAAALGRIGFLLRDRNPVEPRECLVVESTADGVEAARRAGMRSLAIAPAGQGEWPNADFVRPSFDAVDLDQVLRHCAA